MHPPVPSPSRALARGLTRRCPRCGAHAMFEGWFTMRGACGACGWVFEREPGFFLGAFTLNLGAVLAALMATIAAGFALTYPEPEPLPIAAAAIAAAVLVPLAFYPISRSLWAAIDLVMRPPDQRD